MRHSIDWPRFKRIQRKIPLVTLRGDDKPRIACKCGYNDGGKGLTFSELKAHVTAKHGLLDQGVRDYSNPHWQEWQA